MGYRNHYHVYVIELSKDVLYEGRFKKANPDYVLGKPCVYVGMTGLDPDLRFDKHKAGLQSNRYVRQFGLRLLPHLSMRVTTRCPMTGRATWKLSWRSGCVKRGTGCGRRDLAYTLNHSQDQNYA